jgi:hypothetical protein
MGESVERQRVDAGIAEQNLQPVPGRRVPAHRGRDVAPNPLKHG